MRTVWEWIWDVQVLQGAGMACWFWIGVLIGLEDKAQADGS